jgi:hypothetical protein
LIEDFPFRLLTGGEFLIIGDLFESGTGYGKDIPEEELTESSYSGGCLDCNTNNPGRTKLLFCYTCKVLFMER